MRKHLVPIAGTLRLFFLLLVMVSATGCKSWRQVSAKRQTTTTVKHTDSTTRTDSVNRTTDVRVNTTVGEYTEKERRDTGIGLPGETIKYVGNDDTVIRKGSLTLRTHTDKDGNRHTECTADSLTLVIKGLQRENSRLLYSKDSSNQLLATQKTATVDHSDHNQVTTTLTEVVTKQNTGIVFYFKHGFYILMLLLAGMAIQKWIVPLIKRFYLWRTFGK